MHSVFNLSRIFQRLQYQLNQKQYQNKRMFNQTNQCYYYLPVNTLQQTAVVPQFYYSLSSLEGLIVEIQKMKQQKDYLICEINQQQLEKQRLERVNNQLKESIQGGESKSKRRYRKRRVWLQKKFRCNAKGCSSKYSSKIALNSHKRKKHPKVPKESV